MHNFDSSLSFESIQRSVFNSSTQLPVFDYPNNRFISNSLYGRDRLELGGGNMTFSKTHVLRRINGIGLRSGIPNPDYGHSLLTTEYKTHRQLLEEDPSIFQTIRDCENMGVAFDFGVDGTTIDKRYEGHRFKEIRWNCPDLGEPFFTCGSKLPETIFKTALAASHLQREGDKLHFSLIAPNSNYHLFQALQYDITKVLDAGYELHAIKPSGSKRYVFEDEEVFSKWIHKMTNGSTSLKLFEENIDEIIFTRTVQKKEDKSRSEILSEAEGYRNVLNENGKKIRKVSSKGFYFNVAIGDPLSSDSEGSDIEDLDTSSIRADNSDLESSDTLFQKIMKMGASSSIIKEGLHYDPDLGRFLNWKKTTIKVPPPSIDSENIESMGEEDLFEKIRKMGLSSLKFPEGSQSIENETYSSDLKLPSINLLLHPKIPKPNLKLYIEPEGLDPIDPKDLEVSLSASKKDYSNWIKSDIFQIEDVDGVLF